VKIEAPFTKFLSEG